MTAQQINASDFNPNELNLVQVATYQRTIRASITRVWENVLDWEHLPWLHDTSFSHIEVDTAGDWGWRTWSNPEKTDHIELTVADSGSYVARSYRTQNQISEIWTHLTADGDQTDIEVKFYLPDVADDQVEKVGNLMLTLYTQLWNEDEDMMMERQRRLDEQRDRQSEVELGARDAVVARLENNEHVSFQLQGREFQLRLHDDELLAHSTICPHLLGPLKDSEIADGTVICPWHGYRFDLASGDCVSPATANCRLPAAPELSVSGDQLIARSRR